MTRSRTCFWVLGILAAACSSTDTERPGGELQASEQKPEEDRTPGNPLAPVSPPDAGSTTMSVATDGAYACIVKGDPSYGSHEVPTWRETWDAATRVHTRYTTAAPDSQIELAWRFDAQGREQAYIGIRNSFQHDYQYDEHGNVKDFFLSYPPRPDLFVPSSSAPWMGTSYANEYNAQGVLVASTATPYGAGNTSAKVVRKTFAEDAQGRCVRIETTGGRVDLVETRSYNDAGRLSAVHRESSQSLAFNFECKTSTERYAYDSAGRIESVTQRCDGGPEAPAIRQETRAYAADESVMIEVLYFDTDVGEELTIDGKKTFAARHSEKRSPGCAELDQAIARVDTACRPL